ncbi:MAG: hypothetical protein PWQ55_2424 [Chloroflexota bacterium]|nr:hypothetical protein [Chloroflexota bacterium]
MEDVTFEKTNNSASPSLSGYLYQGRFALAEALKKLRNQIEFSVSIESLDDVVFSNGDDYFEILQTKHHINRNANLTDASKDLWKSIKIWCDLFKSEINLNLYFYLITTSSIKEDSIASYLSMGTNRNIEYAIGILDTIANTSSNVENEVAYATFRSLTHEEKQNLFNSVCIIGSNPNLYELDNFIKQEVCFAVDRKYLENFLMRLEGWWDRRVIQQLSSETSEPILSEEILYEMNLLREQFKEDNLPIDEEIISLSIEESDFTERVFVKQLELININEKRIFFAIRDYFRAFAQRSRWIREDLLYVGELDKYEIRLKEEWEMHFEQMRDDLGEDATELQKQKAAKELYKWIEQGDLLQIRPGVREPFLPRGSFHILSDKVWVGWHLEFKDRLKALLEI